VPHHPTAEFSHQPVMVDAVVDLFAPVPAGLLVDATVGGGGHAQALLDARDDVELLGLDRDDRALEASSERLASFGSRVHLRRARFDHLAEELDALGQADVAGVLFDLGVSSPQLDVAERGFSYRHEGPLDMRMDDRDRHRAEEVVNSYDEGELARVLSRYGDERHARRIARAIVAARPIRTTTELADVVREAIPAAARRRGGHPAKRTFQAIRIEVNGELEVLPTAIDQAIRRLAPGGRCAVLTYHSGEDRIVKDVFSRATSQPAPPGLPVEPRPAEVRFVSRRAWRPGADEVQRNPRAESARLRAVERVTSTTSAQNETKVEEG
jgi:16S rRNA (cytosine1402-N4)-methyltransferase